MKQKCILIGISVLLCATAGFSYSGKTSVKNNLPAVFIKNNGQIKDQYNKPRRDILYSFQSGGLNLFIGSGALHYQFGKTLVSQLAGPDCKLGVPGTSQALIQSEKSKSYSVASYRMDVELAGAIKDIQPEISSDELYYEQFLDNNGKNNIRATSCKRLLFKNIYPEIDWVLFVNGNSVEYEFQVHQGGNVDDIDVRYRGCSSIKIDSASGMLVATTPMGEVREHPPVCFSDGNKQIPARVQVKGDDIRFKLSGNYSGTLTIDPLLEWGTYYGADTSVTYFYDLVADDSANIYGCGMTYSDNAGTIATSGAFQNTYAGNEDGFIVKFDSSGNRLWGTYFGGSQLDWVSTITYDHKGHIYIAGSTASDSGIATPGTQEPIYVGGQWDAFLAKFDIAGNRIWGTYVGGTDVAFFDIEVGSVVCDTLGHVYVSGACDDTSNIATPGCFKYTKTEGVDHYDSYLIQYDTMGIRQWGTYYGGNMDDLGGVGASDGNFIYLSGWTYSDTGIASSTGFQTALAGSSDAYLAKFDVSGHRIWGTYYGGAEQEQTGMIRCTATTIVMLGTTTSDTGIATPGCFQPLRAGNADAFVGMFDAQTSAPDWCTYFGGPDVESVSYGKLAFGDTGDIFVCGTTASTSGIATTLTWQSVYGGGVSDGFIAKYDSIGTLKWSTYYGGSVEDQAVSCAFDGKAIYVCGHTNSTNALATPGSFLDAGGGLTYDYQGFLSKFQDTTISTQVSHTAPLQGLRLFPNPNSGSFALSARNNAGQSYFGLIITNAEGQVVYTTTIYQPGQQLMQNVNLGSGLPSGNYFLYLNDQNSFMVLPFTKE